MFTRRKRYGLAERRRLRFTERWAAPITILAVVVERLAQADVISAFPRAWHPYVIGAAAALGTFAIAEHVERRRDYKRFVERKRDREESNP